MTESCNQEVFKWDVEELTFLINKNHSYWYLTKQNLFIKHIQERQDLENIEMTLC